MRGKEKAVNKRLTRGIGWLTALMMCCLMLVVAPTSAWAVEDVTLYVGGAGASDENAGTSESSPLASLAAAFGKIYGEAGQNVTIYVTGNQIVDSTMMVWEDSVTLIGVGDAAPVLTRSEAFKERKDPARGTYNGAMIEVGGSTGSDIRASLTLKNVVLDDNGLHGGERFLQAASNGGKLTESTISSVTVKVGNNNQTHFPAESTDVSFLVAKKEDDKGNTYYATKFSSDQIVQDAIIASYNGKGDITLGEGVVLRNYGGMSAVRITGSSTLTMLAGSAIEDTMNVERSRTYVELNCGTANCTDGKHAFPVDLGPAGAVWMQGGMLDMHQGAIIGGAGEDTPMVGRAIYDEGGNASIGGTIQNLEGTDEVWQGQNGVVIHLRVNAKATLTSTGRITNVTGTYAGNNSAIWTQFCNFKTEKDSAISHVDSFQLLHFDDLDNNNYSHEVYLDGVISDCALRQSCLLRSWYGQITFGSNSIIENCSSSCAGGLIYSNNGSHYTFKGTIRNNTAPNGMVYLANQSGGDVIATIEDGAHIVDNKGLGVRVNNSSLLTMNGGEIARNSDYGVRVSGKTNWTGVKFIMNGGTIADNGSYGIWHEVTAGGKSLVEINGGAISGNRGVGGLQIYSPDGNAVAEQGDTAGYEYTHVAAGTMGEPRTVCVSAGTVTLPEGYADVNLGRATTEAANLLKSSVEKGHSDWTVIGDDALWIQPSATEFSFKLDPASSPKKTGLFAAYIQVNPDGSPVKDAEVKIETAGKVDNAGNVPITLKNLTADAPYAVLLFNNKEYTLAPDDVTKYIGGGQGNENYGDGFPAITMYNSVDEIKKMKINGSDVNEEEGVTFENALLDLVNVSYFDEKGQAVDSDEQPGIYTVRLSWKEGQAPEVIINDNNVSTKLGEGKLIVRHIADVEGAQEGTTTYELLTDEPAKPVEHAEAIAIEDNNATPKFYTNNDENREVDAEGIQLLDDDLLTYEDEDRTTPMENKGDEHLGSAGEGKEWSYEFHYLDLVDAYNGNAWVSASYGTTIYLPYPEGITAGNAEKVGVKVIHYKDLHREYGITGQADVEAAIEACDMETMTAEFTEQGIKFDTERAGFSPFAIAWKTDAPDEPDTPVTPPSKHYTITASAGEGGSISPSGTVSVTAGADKTFTFTPDEGNRVADVIVDGESLGALGSYTFEDIVRDHTIQVVFKPGNAPADPDDTGVSDWLNTKDHDVYLHGYQDGSNTFKPNGNMTRGEVACMFYNLLLDKSMGDASVAFEDVPEGAFYAEPIRVLASRGILFGTSPTTFDPDRPITRAEFTAIAMRFSKGDLSGENIFVDVAEGAWYYDVIVGSIKYGWIYGYQDGSHRFGPDDTITRAEATCIANRMLGRLPDGAYIAEHKDELKLFADVTEEHFAWRDIVEATNAHDYVKDGGYEDWTSLKDGADA